MRVRSASAVLIAAYAFAAVVSACSFPPGYFHQATALKGRNLHAFGPLQYWRWLRQSPLSNAELTLVEYRSIEDKRSNKPVRRIASVKADKGGWFDFGLIAAGHYTLNIQGFDLVDSFDVEITPSVPTTDYVTIDVSPVYSDCKGGHEFVVKKIK